MAILLTIKTEAPLIWMLTVEEREFSLIGYIGQHTDVTISSVRFMTPCDDQTCNWVDDPSRYMSTRRWYPTLEGLPDGSLFVCQLCTSLRPI